MKNAVTFFLLTILFILSSTACAQRFNWNGNTPNESVEEYILGVIHKMDTDRDCTDYAYGKDRYKRVEVYSYTTDGLRIRFKFRFYWQIDYMAWPSKQFSFTLSVSTMMDGCSTRVTFEDHTGGNDCDCRIGKTYDLGCVY
jgi:hypothetical protein